MRKMRKREKLDVQSGSLHARNLILSSCRKKNPDLKSVDNKFPSSKLECVTNGWGRGNVDQKYSEQGAGRGKRGGGV
jgi:hypothetical protein